MGSSARCRFHAARGRARKSCGWTRCPSTYSNRCTCGACDYRDHSWGSAPRWAHSCRLWAKEPNPASRQKLQPHPSRSTGLPTRLTSSLVSASDARKPTCSTCSTPLAPPAGRRASCTQAGAHSWNVRSWKRHPRPRRTRRGLLHVSPVSRDGALGGSPRRSGPAAGSHYGAASAAAGSGRTCARAGRPSLPTWAW